MTESDGTNWIWAYYQMIQENTVVVGHWIRRWYEIVVQRLQDGTYIFDQKKANRAINFIERYVHHHEGPLAPGLLKLQPWQKAFVSVVYGIVGEDGKRVFREIVLLIGRKQGKSAVIICLTMAGMAVACMCVRPNLTRRGSAMKGSIRRLGRNLAWTR